MRHVFVRLVFLTAATSLVLACSASTSNTLLGVQPQARQYSSLPSAAYSNDYEAVLRMLDEGHDPNGVWTRDGERLSALQEAVIEKNYEMCRLLVERGADVNFISQPNRNTPLHTAVKYHQAGIARLLLENGADPDIRNSEGLTPDARGRSFGFYDLPDIMASIEAEKARQAEIEQDRLRRMEGEAFEAARAGGTEDSLASFLEEYPNGPHRQDALKALAAVVSAGGERARMRSFSARYPDGAGYLPGDYGLLFLGPEGMQVADIPSLLKEGFDEKVIASKIKTSDAMYKDFSFREMGRLKKMGITDTIISAMIESTHEAKKKDEETRKDREMKALLAEIERMQKKIEALQSQPAGTAYAPAGASQDSGPSVGGTVANCAAQLAALEACKQLSGFSQSVCRATAKSSFPCE